MYNTNNFSDQSDRARKCEEAIWAYLLDRAEVRARRLATYQAAQSDTAEDVAIGAVSTTVEYLKEKDKPRTWETEEERLALMPYIDRVYYTISKRAMCKVVKRERKYNAGSLDEPTASGTVRGELLADPRTVSGDVPGADDELGGLLGLEVRQTMREMYTPEQMDQWWNFFVRGYNWAEVAGNPDSIEKVKKWGNRQCDKLRIALEKRGITDERGGANPRPSKQTPDGSQDASGVDFCGIKPGACPRAFRA